MKTLKYQSTVTCPFCGFKKEEVMPENSCQFFYQCENCKRVFKTEPGHCCVFCSYGTTRCPSCQKGESCCA